MDLRLQIMGENLCKMLSCDIGRVVTKQEVDAGLLKERTKSLESGELRGSCLGEEGKSCDLKRENVSTNAQSMASWVFFFFFLLK